MDSSSDSDFDENEDPDNIEVPGGGKSLASVIGLKTPQNGLTASRPPSRAPSSTSRNDQPAFLKKIPRTQEEKLKFPFNPMSQKIPTFANLASRSNLTVNQMVNQSIINQTNINQEVPVYEEEDADDEEMAVVDTYADYMPSKLKLGRKHPDPVVETATLASVEPVDIRYKLSIPQQIIQKGALSALQLEAITYASQQHEHFLPDNARAGFLIGDGAGVGKGRTVAGIIYENYLRGRKKSLWISVSNDLKFDAIRDLNDIEAYSINVHPLNKLKYANISSDVNGNIKKGVIFSTYSALIGETSQQDNKQKSRLQQILQWCGEDFDGVIVFDECHRAKNLCPVGGGKSTKTGLAVLRLQEKLPKARVVYASATGATEPRNMAYMVRLGLWGKGTPFPEFADFITSVEKRGVGAMEIVAMDMKLRGMYIARQLSFRGVSFRIEEVPLNNDFMLVYDEAVRLWVKARQLFEEALGLIDAENNMKKTTWGQFWSSHQRFFKYMCIAAKVKYAVGIAHEAVKCGKCIVIGLQSTGEARTLEQLEREDGELTDFVSSAKGVFESLVSKHFPAPDRSRINKILGLNLPETTKSIMSSFISGIASSSSTKRKPEPPSCDPIPKKIRTEPVQILNIMQDDFKNDFELSDSENQDVQTDSELESEDDGSNCSSDHNPFGSGSDSDEDPWAKRKRMKKIKKLKKVKVANEKCNNDDELKTLPVQKSIEPQNEPKLSQMNMFTKPHAIRKVAIEVSEPPPTPQNDFTSSNNIDRACRMKEELLNDIDKLGEKLPPNTLDQLIDELGGPENVAEMTGRKGRVVQSEDGTVQYESRNESDVPLETLNVAEKQRFMDGEKTVAIISEAASSGISLHSDRRAINQMHRVHITLELPWSADRAIQQFGRTHRSNQVNAPEYLFLISNLAGERRFASIVAKRLESLGALTHGDRRATESHDLSQFNIDNRYGRAALEATMSTIVGYDKPIIPTPKNYPGDFFKDAVNGLVGVGMITKNESMPGVYTLDKDYGNMSKFLNRILGLPVNLQNSLFQYFTDTLTAVIDQAKRAGRFDLGILDLGTSRKSMRHVKLTRYFRKHSTGVSPAELHTLQMERGMNWTDVMSLIKGLDSKYNFYLSNQPRNGRYYVTLAVVIKGLDDRKSVKNQSELNMIYKPNTGLQVRRESTSDLEKKYRKVMYKEAEKHWVQQYKASYNICSHVYWTGHCRSAARGMECEIGLRFKTYNVLSGSVLSVWSQVEYLLSSSHERNRIQVLRLQTDEGLKIVGTVIPKSCLDMMHKMLATDAERIEEKKF